MVRRRAWMIQRRTEIESGGAAESTGLASDDKADSRDGD